LLAALADLDPPEEFRVYLNAPGRPTELRMPGVAVPIPARRLWTVRRLAAEMRRDPPDLLFVPSHVIPPVHPRSVVTIHDLGYLAEPNSHPPTQRAQLDWTTRWNVRASAGLIAVSESTKQDLIEHLDVDPARIRTVYHGVSSHFAPAPEAEIEAIRRKFELGPSVVLAVGTLQPRKNLVRLIQAFERLATQAPEVQLVLSGAPGWKFQQILHRATASPFHKRIKHIDYIPDAELPALYSSGAVLAFPSLYEGFGLPALEAMACGTPVVAANRSSLPEICGDAALLVDPFDAASIADGIERVLGDEDRRNELIERGFRRAGEFRWKDSAEKTLAFLRSIGDN
jgi:glycosyltransferase involved in cell wall biosynthesis